MSVSTTPSHPRASEHTLSPPARRSSGTSWRDPRLVVGVALLAGSVLAGSWLLSAADETVPVWAARRDLPVGVALGEADLVRSEVRFSSAAEADRYLSAEAPLPAGAAVMREIGAGELLPRAALDSAAPEQLIEVPIATTAELVPSTVRAGSVVDVWVTPEEGSEGDSARSVLLFHDVPVLAAPQTASSLAPTASRQLIIGLGGDQEATLEQRLALLTSGTIVVTRRG